jgi:hypothetical protein
MEPIFFLLQFTDRQVRIQAVDRFDAKNGTYYRLAGRSPRVTRAAGIMDAFQVAAREMDAARIDSAKIVEASAPLLDCMGLVPVLLPATRTLPQRIMVHGK